MSASRWKQCQLKGWSLLSLPHVDFQWHLVQVFYKCQAADTVTEYMGREAVLEPSNFSCLEARKFMNGLERDQRNSSFHFDTMQQHL